MLAIILFLIVIVSFSFFSAFVLNSRFERTIPISTMGIVLVLYVFGLISALKVGYIIVCIGAIGLYVYTIIYVVKNNIRLSIEKNIWNLITPGFIAFIVLAILISYYNQNRLAIHTDEFSHWLDTIVIMTKIDDFGTAINSTAIFPSYPPAMSLLQYFMEKINIAITGDFSEWKNYYVYQLFAVIIMLPFIGDEYEQTSRKIASIILWPICLFVPLLFFSDVYSSLYIDPFLGILGGCGFASIYLSKNKDWMYEVYMIMLCSVLTISKDVGIYLALFIGAFYFIDGYSRRDKRNKTGVKSIVISYIECGSPIISTMIVKFLWKIELIISKTTQKFSQPFNIAGMLETLRGQGTEFNNAVLENFKSAITYRYVYYERIGMNYTAIMLFITLILIVMSVSLYRENRLKKGVAVAGTIISSGAIIIYILSMFPLYISRFAPEEALNLASFDRYCGIMFLTGILAIFWLIRDRLCSSLTSLIIIILSIACLCSVIHSKKDLITYYTSRQSVRDSLDFRNQVNILAGKINDNCEEDANILLIVNDGQDIFRAILSTLDKPRTIDSSEEYFPCTFNDETPITDSEFMEILEKKYDYVAIYDCNEVVEGCYSKIFEDDLVDGGLYKLNEDKKLQLVVQ